MVSLIVLPSLLRFDLRFSIVGLQVDARQLWGCPVLLPELLQAAIQGEALLVHHELLQLDQRLA